MRRMLLACMIACLMAGCSPEGGEGPEKRETLSEQEQGSKEEAGEAETAVSTDRTMEMLVPEGWEVFEDPKPYDLRMTNSKAYTGMLVYTYFDLAEDVEAADIFEYHISDLMSRREHVSVYQEKEAKALDHKTITQITYIGEKDLSKNIYYFSMVEFEGEERFAIVIQTSIPSEFEGNREELDAMVESVELTGAAGPPIGV